MIDLENLFTPEELENTHPDTLAVLRHYPFHRIPVEGALYFNTWVSHTCDTQGIPAGTAMIGLYSEVPRSASCFHRLPYPEVWHAYGGDPFQLILLHPDGSSESVRMGCNPLNGDLVQFVVPANSWQAGEILPGGRYALFGCTMAPGFDGSIFEAADSAELIRQYPERKTEILRLSGSSGETRMPAGYTV
ncbi:MAG: cupin domain-containing protein [Anaerolineae bacterium]|nr:cupin domain-containing protein [Anaerolineae bacterium]